MSSLFNNDLHEPVEQDREISLGAATVIGIFFALALLCALFFGLGYSMGRRSTQAAEAAPADAPPVSSSTATTPKPRSAIADTPPPVSAQPVSTQPANAGAPSPAAAPVTATLPQPTTEKPPSTTTFMVQVAAVSHREDADTLIQALDQRGYDVAIRQEPQDKLFHVQIGPFSVRRDAEAMRQHLLADGYNAIVK